MSWSSSTVTKRRLDRQVLFVVHYRDGSKAYMRVPLELATFGGGLPSVLRLAHERQTSGELPPGQIEKLVRAH